MQVLRCKSRKLTDQERELADKAQNIDEKFPRPTPEEVKALLDKITTQQDEDSLDDSDEEAIKELG